jgi:hypothetical protein
MDLSRIALINAASGFAGFGAACLVDPSGMLSRVSVHGRSARGRTELRAMYGGFELGLGAFFAAAAFKPEWKQTALVAQSLGLGGLAASRMAGILRDRPSGVLMKLLFAAEAATAVAAVIALAMNRQKTRAESPA